REPPYCAATGLTKAQATTREAATIAMRAHESSPTPMNAPTAWLASVRNAKSVSACRRFRDLVAQDGQVALEVLARAIGGDVVVVARDFAGRNAVLPGEPDHQPVEGFELRERRLLLVEMAFEHDLDAVGGAVLGVGIAGIGHIAALSDAAGPVDVEVIGHVAPRHLGSPIHRTRILREALQAAELPLQRQLRLLLHSRVMNDDLARGLRLHHLRDSRLRSPGRARHDRRRRTALSQRQRVCRYAERRNGKAHRTEPPERVDAAGGH